nr:hypothetical protein [Tanacetum cinerariifolium]
MFDCGELISSDSDVSMPPSPVHDRHIVPTAILTRSRLVPLTTARPFAAVVPQTKVQHQRPTNHGVNKVNAVKGVKENWGNPQQALKDKGVIDSGCSRHITRNISYVSDFEAINGGYVSFGRNPKGGKITGKDTKCIILSSNFKLPDDNHVLLRVPRENNMYNVDLKNIVPSEDLTYLFAKATLDESNLWHRRLGHINFKIMNKLVKDTLGKFDGKADEGFLVGYSPVVAGNQPNSSASIQENFDAGKVGEGNVQQHVLFPLWSTGSKDPLNTDVNASFEVMEPESKVHVSPSSCDKTKKHDDKTKKEAKGKSHVELSTGVQNLCEEFEDYSSNSTNGVNAASTLVTAVEPNSPNSTKTFSVAGPSNNVVRLNFEFGGKSSFVDPSKYPDDLDMPALEDITYSDDEENGGAEADFSNLETSITVSLFPTLRVHKDHPVNQIIGDLSFASQIRRFKDPDYPDKVYKVVKGLYGLHQAPRAWYETLANYLLENDLCKAFEKLMKDKFQMSSVGEITFILGLQVKQNQDGIFISQDKYVAEILRKFGLTDGKSASSPIDTEKPLLKDPDGEDVDLHTYRSMIVKRIFRYLKGKLQLGLWYPKDSPFTLVAYSDSDYARASLDRKSTTRGCQFLGCRLISWQCKKQIVVATSVTKAELIITTVSSKLMLFGLTIAAVRLMLLVKKRNVRLQALRMKVIITKDTIRQALRLNDADSVDCLPNEEIFVELAWMGYEKPYTKLTFYKAFFSA